LTVKNSALFIFIRIIYPAYSNLSTIKITNSYNILKSRIVVYGKFVKNIYFFFQKPIDKSITIG
jgi:hypothetical protein